MRRVAPLLPHAERARMDTTDRKASPELESGGQRHRIGRDKSMPRRCANTPGPDTEV
jgi:hypothetical protein